MLVPPITTAAITVSSMPVAGVGLPGLRPRADDDPRERRRTAPESANVSARIGADPHAGQPRRLGLPPAA